MAKSQAGKILTKKRQTQNFDLKDKQVFKQDRFDKYYQTGHYNINFIEYEKSVRCFFWTNKHLETS